jgi:hypothetical protein
MVPVRDENALAESILRNIEGGRDKALMAERVREFSRERAVLQYLELIEKGCR